MKTVPFVRLSKLMRSGTESLDPRRFAKEIFELYSIPAFETRLPEIVEGGSVGSAKQIVDRNDVLLSRIVPHIRRAWVVGQANGRRQIASGEWIVFRSKQADPRYLSHVLVGDDFHQRFMMTVAGVGGSLLRARSTQVAEIEIPLPNLNEQRRIAAILDEADALRAKRRAALAQLDEMAQAIFVETFGHPTTNPKDWPTCPISDIGKIVTGNTPPRSNAVYYGAAIEWIKSDNLNNPSYYATRAEEGLSLEGVAVARVVPASSILVTCIAGSPDCIGNSAMVDRTVSFNQQINAIIPTNCNPHFLYSQLRVGKTLIQEASTASMKGMVSKSRFEQICVMVPPRTLQDQFERHAIKTEEVRANMVASSNALDSLFVSLQHRAFRGEL